MTKTGREKTFTSRTRIAHRWRSESRPRASRPLRTTTWSRKNIPTAEYQSVMEKADQSPVQVAYRRRNRDLDPQLVWRGKDEQNWSDLVVQAPPLFIQEKVHPKVLIDDLLRRSHAGERKTDDQIDLFADFNGLPDDNARTEFYRHDAKLVQPDDPRRQPAGDGLAGGARGAARQGAVRISRPALRHQVQLQLPVVHHQPRREGRKGRNTSRASPSRSRRSATRGATASTRISNICGNA